MSYAADLAYHANNSKIAANLRDGFPHPYTVEDAVRYIEFCMADSIPGKYVKAIVINKTACGSIGVFFKDDVYAKNGELGYWLSEDYWNKGIMTEAILSITNLVFECFDIARIFAEPFSSNIGSRKVLEKAGFQLEGVLRKSVFKNGAFNDSCLYARLKDA